LRDALGAAFRVALGALAYRAALGAVDLAPLGLERASPLVALGLRVWSSLLIPHLFQSLFGARWRLP